MGIERSNVGSLYNAYYLSALYLETAIEKIYLIHHEEWK